LHSIVGRIEVAKASGEESEHSPALLTRQPGDGVGDV